MSDGSTLLLQGDMAVLSALKYRSGGELSLLEHTITPGSHWVGKPIHDFSPRSKELVIMVIRGSQTLLSTGDSVILENDILVIHAG